MHASAQADVLGAMQLEATEGQTRAVEQLQSLLQESRQQGERLRTELCRRRSQVCCALEPTIAPSNLTAQLWAAWLP